VILNIEKYIVFIDFINAQLHLSLPDF